MPVIAIVGAGLRLGLAAARKFGREGFSVALIARNPEKLGELEQLLAADGIAVGSYIADVRDRSALSTALARAADEIGPVDVLQFNPNPSGQFLRPILDTEVADLAAATEFSVLGLATAVERVLPGMMQRRSGTILFVNGASATRPNKNVAGTSVAFAAESAYGAMLHEALEPHGIGVHQLIVPGAIGGGNPIFEPEALADRLWALHSEPGGFRVTVAES